MDKLALRLEKVIPKQYIRSMVHPYTIKDLALAIAKHILDCKPKKRNWKDDKWEKTGSVKICQEEGYNEALKEWRSNMEKE